MTDNVGQVEQRVLGGGLDLEHVKGRAGNVTGFQQLGQRFFVHQTTTGAVDDAHALFGLGKVFAAQDVCGLSVKGTCSVMKSARASSSSSSTFSTPIFVGLFFAKKGS